MVDAKDAKKDAKGAAKGPAKGDTAGQAVDEKFKILNELKYNYDDKTGEANPNNKPLLFQKTVKLNK